MLFPLVPVIPIICLDKILTNSSVCDVNLLTSITVASATIPGLLNIKSYLFNSPGLLNFLTPSISGKSF